MIPEGVYVVTSASTARSKSFKNIVGVFDYTYLNHCRYAIGIDQGENSGGRFLIATPEKALADLVHKKSKKLTPKELIVDLIDGRRIDAEQLKNLNKQHLQDIAMSYSSQAVTNLIHAVGLL